MSEQLVLSRQQAAPRSVDLPPGQPTATNTTPHITELSSEIHALEMLGMTRE